VQFKFGVAAALAVGLLPPVSATAATKYISCDQMSTGGEQFVTNATIGDESEEAEVELYSTTAACAKNHSCGTQVYKKKVLPSVIRLVEIIVQGELRMTTTIDINRSTLGVVTVLSLSGTPGTADTRLSGTCKVRIEQAKKLL
jgi:hypothetical protein